MAKPTSHASPTPPLPFQQKPQPGADSTQSPHLAASTNPSENPSRRSDLMLLGTRKRGHAGNGDGDGGGGGGGGPALLGNQGLGSYAQPGHSGAAAGGGVHGDDVLCAALVDALGLGSFVRLVLPAPPDGLDLAAAVEPSSGCIIVSIEGDSIAASPADLAAALSLPPGPFSLSAEFAALFSSVEAITAVWVFVQRLLGGTGDVHQVLPEETIEALQLVEDGKPYAVDWGRFVWAILWSDVLIGEGRRWSRHLLRLVKCQRPDLFSEFDGRFLGKRKTCLMLQQEEKLLHGNSGYDQIMAAEEAEVQEKLVVGLSKNIVGKMPALGSVKDQQHSIETEDQEDGNHDNNVGPSLPSFYDSRQQVLDHVSKMENVILEKERSLTHNRAENKCMKEKLRKKDNQIARIVEGTKEELKARHAHIKQLEHDQMVMASTLHGYQKLCHESSAAFLEYRKLVQEGSGVSSLDVVADEKNQVCLMQQQRRAYEIINGILKPLLLKFSACAKNIRVMLTKIADLNNEVQRLKGSRSIPDLNVGPDL